MNGIDYTEWHPSTDEFLRKDGYTNYDVESLEDGKARCKAALQKVRAAEHMAGSLAGWLAELAGCASTGWLAGRLAG